MTMRTLLSTALLALAACSEDVDPSAPGATATGSGGTSSSTVAGGSNASSSSVASTGTGAGGPGGSGGAGGTPAAGGAGGDGGSGGVLGAWSLRFGDAAKQAGTDLAVMPDDGVVLTGRGAIFDNSPPIGPGEGIVPLGKVSTNGAVVWSKGVHCDGGTKVYSFSRVAAHGSDVVLIAGCGGEADFGTGSMPGGGGSDVVVARYDASGNAQWVKRFGNNGDQFATAIAATVTGTTLIAGSFDGSLDLGAGPYVLDGTYATFVAELDVDGDLVWAREIDPEDGAIVWGLAATSDGGVVVTGEFRGTMDLGGGPLVSAGERDIFVARLDSAGDHVWSKRFGAADEQDFVRVAIDGNGDIVVFGHYEVSIDFGGGPMPVVGNFSNGFVAKLGPAGDHIWSQRFGSQGVVQAGNVVVDGLGNVYITGEYSGGADLGGGALPEHPGDCVLIAKLDPTGGHVWSQGYPVPGFGIQSGAGIGVDSTGTPLVTGWYDGAIDFGQGPLVSAGDEDAFLVKLSP